MTIGTQEEKLSIGQENITSGLTLKIASKRIDIGDDLEIKPNDPSNPIELKQFNLSSNATIVQVWWSPETIMKFLADFHGIRVFASDKNKVSLIAEKAQGNPPINGLGIRVFVMYYE